MHGTGGAGEQETADCGWSLTCLVKIGRRTECEAVVRHQGKKVRWQWLDEMKQGPDGPFIRCRLLVMEMADGVRFDTVASIKIIISRAASTKNRRGRHTRVPSLHDISVALGHALQPHDEPIAMYPPRGEDEAGCMGK